MDTSMDLLRTLLSPKSIVIVGASADANKINGRPIRNLRRDGYAGRVYLVNPKYTEIMGYPCFADVDSLPEVPELGVVGVAAEGAPKVVAALGAKGVRMVVVWSSGFGETGPAGKRLESALLAAARQWGMRLCGPNALGLTNAFDCMPLTFSQYADTPLEAGPVAFVSQSGAFGTAVATAARSRGIGLGYFVSTGNQPDLTVSAVVNALLDDDRIRVVVAYMEGLSDGEAFVLAARKALALAKPLVVVKVGRHAAGTRAAVSHTGALACDDAVFDSVIRQLGVLRADNEGHALDLVAALVHARFGGPTAGSHVQGIGLITLSGGAGALMADLAEDRGLQVPLLDSEVQRELGTVLPGFAATGNPVDVTGQAVEDVRVIGRSLDIVLRDPQVALAVIWVQLLHSKAEQLADLLIDCRRRATKPFVLCWLNSPPATVRRLREAGVCVADSTLGGVQAAAGLVAFGQALQHRTSPEAMTTVTGTIARPEAGATEIVGSIEAGQLLARYGLGLAEARLAYDADEAVAMAATIGFPVAVKIESADIAHKTEVDGVRLNLADGDAVRTACAQVLIAAHKRRPDARIDGVVVQAMKPAATEFVLGLRRDAAFGPVLMVGLGGVFIEALRDVVFATLPLSRTEAQQMLGRLRCQPMLDGVRGRAAVDRMLLVDAMCALSRLAQAHPEIVELDLNPVFLSSREVVAVDWLMIREARA